MIQNLWKGTAITLVAIPTICRSTLIGPEFIRVDGTNFRSLAHLADTAMTAGEPVYVVLEIIIRRPKAWLAHLAHAAYLLRVIQGGRDVGVLVQVGLLRGVVEEEELVEEEALVEEEPVEADLPAEAVEFVK